MQWYDEFNAVFFLSVGSLVVAILAFCFKSKCSEMNLCGPLGLLRIVRNVEAENEEQQFEITHPQEEQV